MTDILKSIGEYAAYFCGGLVFWGMIVSGVCLFLLGGKARPTPRIK